MEVVVVAYAVRDNPIVTIENTYRGDEDKWAIRQHGQCLNKSMEWEYEPQPSSRDEEFFARCRFSLDEAKKMLENDKVKVLILMVR